MISRYSRDIVTNIWSQESKYKIWLDIEIYAAEAMEKYKIIPKGVAGNLRKKSKINVKRIVFAKGFLPCYCIFNLHCRKSWSGSKISSSGYDLF